MDSFLTQVELFQGIPPEDLRRLAQRVTEVRLAPGERLFAEGERGDHAYIIKSGELEIIRISDGREVLLAVRKPFEVIGEMALLQAMPRTATVRARCDSLLLAVSKEQFDQLVSQSLPAARAMFYTVVSRWLSTVGVLRHSEKMAQLGTLTAGVAHELNNPAAAVRRGAQELPAALSRWEQAQQALLVHGLRQVDLAALAGRVAAAAARPPALNAVARSDREAEFEEWLDRQGVREPWTYAPTLVSLGLSPSELADRTGGLMGEPLAVLLEWVAAGHGVRSLAHEVGKGAARISEIIRALKSYSYLDQAPIQSVDLHEGLENTLVILRHKLNSIEVIREFDPAMDRIQAHGSELNQVWTNLIDNAADALDGKGRIILRTRRGQGRVVVEVEDDGPGIPPAVREKIWDAFFTTKAPGKGTGLGLDIVYNIVVHKHQGEISVESEPGRTCFRVTLPEQ